MVGSGLWNHFVSVDASPFCPKCSPGKGIQPGIVSQHFQLRATYEKCRTGSPLGMGVFPGKSIRLRTKHLHGILCQHFRKHSFVRAPRYFDGFLVQETCRPEDAVHLHSDFRGHRSRSIHRLEQPNCRCGRCDSQRSRRTVRVFDSSSFHDQQKKEGNVH